MKQTIRLLLMALPMMLGLASCTEKDNPVTPDFGIAQNIHENWEIVTCGNGEMVSKSLHRQADGSTYTITAHLKKVEWD